MQRKGGMSSSWDAQQTTIRWSHWPNGGLRIQDGCRSFLTPNVLGQPSSTSLFTILTLTSVNSEHEACRPARLKQVARVSDCPPLLIQTATGSHSLATSTTPSDLCHGAATPA